MEETQVNPELPRLLAQQAALGARQQIRDGLASYPGKPQAEAGRKAMLSAGFVVVVCLLVAARLITMAHAGS